MMILIISLGLIFSIMEGVMKSWGGHGLPCPPSRAGLVSVFPLIYSCAGNTCGKLVKGCDKLVKGRGKLFKGRGRVVNWHADRSLHLGKTFQITERLFNPWPSNFVTITCNKYAIILRLQIFDSLFCLVMVIFRKSICETRKLGEVVPLKEESQEKN